ncbi:PREDICTED: uncharacterized protein At2g33490 [Prunus mume]|uniref:Uncharacterized protein At2g33490 n=1 Tax=Prunus mume TaxID=102107 RepID=A0ABM0NBN4_PRUMU|nr:PREDICTED: uncharacterized protein At2g33490 [Prunus mume]
MKTSLRKLRGFALHKHDAKDRRDLRPLPQLDELAQAAQGMQDMRDCYDSLLSAAAATANSAYEFSESLREMGSCLLQKTALNDDEESGRVLLKLGKLQFELHKLVDSYRSHIFQTIAVPSESLLNELQTVEEMKRQCDEKRDVYEYMIKRQKEKGRSRGGKGESFSVQQIQLAREEYDEEATLFIFRLKSLKQGQSRSLLTQAARHHAAQLSFFKKALRSVESVEPHVKLVTEQQHIDYEFNGLDDEGNGDNNDDDNDDDDSDVNDDGELSFDYGQRDHDQDVSTSQNSMELDQVDITFPKLAQVEALKDRFRRNSFSFKGRTVSQSAPLFAENNSDRAEKMRHRQPSFSRKFHSYALPTPIDKKSSVSTGSDNPVPHTVQTSLSERTQNLWHSSPLDPKNEKAMGEKKVSGINFMNVQSVLKESNNNIASHQLPPPLTGRYLFSEQVPLAASDSKERRRQAFSGPLTSKHWASKPVSSDHHQMFSGPILRNPVSQPLSSSPKVSPSASPTFMSSPKISELHELPRPPASSTSKSSRPLGLVGHSAPLVPRTQMQSATNKPAVSPTAAAQSATNKPVVSPTASPLPTPPTIARSFSIPSRDPGAMEFHVTEPQEGSPVPEMAADNGSPPLSPLALPNTAK